MTEDFDPARYAIDGPDSVINFRPRPTRKRSEKFVRAPLSWVRAAAVLPGKALALGAFLWFESGCRKSSNAPLNLSRLGITRWAAQRALRTLETAGLVSVERRKGRPPLVTLLDASAEQ